ncbi:MAG: rhodanese-like domain-containing protein [Prevotella sp.]|jgi:rhodanese-related sulfurtransferase
MKKLLSCLLAILGLTTACGQKNYEDADVRDFAELIEKYDVVVLDVRTADEFKEGHIEKALNIDVKQDDFIEKATATLPKDKIIAVYCRSGRRSANAANQLSSVGYQLVNLKGGIMAWKDNNMPVTTANK